MPMPIRIRETEIEGVLEIATGVARDERGYFSEAYSTAVWTDAGFDEVFLQDNISLSAKGTLRGLHYQLEPHAMGKLVRVLRGSAFDVGVDLRKGSPTFGGWVGRTLTADDGVALYFPRSFAHGFVALEEETLVYYKCTALHAPEAERAIHFNDPAIGIEWPLEPVIVSEKDAAAPSLEAAEHNFLYTPSS